MNPNAPIPIQKKKSHYFTSPKKYPLVRKMIFDSNQGQFPESFYDLRPINQAQESLQHLQYEQIQSQMREMSYEEKNSHSHHSFYKIMEEHENVHGTNLFQKADKQALSVSSDSIFDESLSSVKRQRTYYRDVEDKLETNPKTPKKDIIVFQSKQQTPKKKRKSSLVVQKVMNVREFLSSQKLVKSNSKITKLQSQKHYNNNKQNLKIYNRQLQKNYDQIYDISDSSASIKVKEQHIQKKQRDNQEYEIMNQYIELVGYANLFEEMMTVYHNNPLYIDQIQFDSDPEDDNILRNHIDGVKNEDIDEHMHQMSEQYQNISYKSQQVFSLLDRMRINEAPKDLKNDVYKQLKFQKSKSYQKYKQSIEMLKPHFKKMTDGEKISYLEFRKQLKEIKDIMDYFEKRKPSTDQHICKICGSEFNNGRQLGGHMSRKHPGKALNYALKKELQSVKKLEKNRRLYFKKQVRSNNQQNYRFENVQIKIQQDQSVQNGFYEE